MRFAIRSIRRCTRARCPSGRYPALVVHAQKKLDEVRLSVRSDSGRKLRLKAGPVFAGRSHRFEFPLERPSRARYSGTLSVKVGGTSGEMPIDVSVELVAPPKIEVPKASVDLEEKTLKVRSDRGIKRVEVALMSDFGTPLGDREVEFDGTEQEVEVRWKEDGPGTLMRITITGYDADGFFKQVELFPWRVDIPHEEVHFATGSFEIEKPEVPKLEKCYAEVQKAIDKYGAFAKITLFIAGHTDTVGDTASNRTLSNNRARSIGRWFKKRGVEIPIRYAGFGEDILAVQTPDNTDNEENRRAEYIVAVDPPPTRGRIRWTPLGR